jgi:hypothetical protein
MIRGEYWIVDGDVDFADGDVGDYNHEMIATQHVFSQWSDAIANVAEEFGIETDFEGYDGIDCEAISNVINEILEVLKESYGDNCDSVLMQQLGIDQDAYLVICGHGDAKDYVMIHEGWIALRSTNVDLYGYDESKKKSLISGIEEILYQEGIEPEQEEEDLEFQISDHKTNKYYYLTYEEIKNPQPTMRTQQPINTKGDRRFNPTWRDQEENKYSTPVPSKQKPINAAAQKQGIIGPGQQLWRGTSESVGKFKRWLLNN